MFILTYNLNNQKDLDMAENLELEELKEQADELGIKYNPNIGIAKLQEKIDDALIAVEEDDAEAGKAEAEAALEAKKTKEAEKAAEVEEVVETVEEATKSVAKSRSQARYDALREIKRLERENKKTQVVKLTIVDRVEATTAKDAYFSSGGVAMNVPLDRWVEMPNILIDMAERQKVTVQEDDDSMLVKPREQPKYVVQYKKD